MNNKHPCWRLMVIFVVDICMSVVYRFISYLIYYSIVPLHACKKNVEFGNLIPGKICFWREIFAILRENLSFRWIFRSFSYNKSHFDNIFDHMPGKFCIFSSLNSLVQLTLTFLELGAPTYSMVVCTIFRRLCVSE